MKNAQFMNTDAIVPSVQAATPRARAKLRRTDHLCEQSRADPPARAPTGKGMTNIFKALSAHRRDELPRAVECV